MLPPLPTGALPPLPPGVVLIPAPPVPVAVPSYHSLDIAVADTECYRNYWLLKMLSEDGEIFEFEKYPGQELNVAAMVNALTRFTVVTFNGLNYDIPMITLAASGASCNDLKEANDMIIKGRLKYWDFYKHFRLQDPLDNRYGRKALIDHIDLIEPAPGVGVSLKLYGGRMHSKRLQDLPIDADELIAPEQRPLMRQYCGNDLFTTNDLFEQCRERLQLRAAIGAEFGIDVRSKSDAQAAETVFKNQIGYEVIKPHWPHGTTFRYQVPSFISFQTAALQAVLETVRNAEFFVSDKEQVDEADQEGIKTGVLMPKELNKLSVAIGAGVYRMGIGGLHSSESSTYHIADPAVCTLRDADVVSFYPTIIINQGLEPHQMPGFLRVFEALVSARVHAKRMAARCNKEAETLEAFAHSEAGFFDSHDKAKLLRAEAKVWKVKADGYKIMINGTFGKTGSKFSILFAPPILIQTTITGQLSLLMLIESLEQCGIPVVSANTDGVVIKCPIGMEWIRDSIIKDWEARTQYEMEFTDYKSLWSRDVNNYIAIKPNGEVKTKGIFTDTGLQKNPTNAICVSAVTKYLAEGIQPAETIKACTDVRQFLSVRTVKGGAVKGDRYLGKTVRWYYGKGEYGTINYGTNGNRVPRSEGAVPMMELVATLPDDIDYDWYIRESYAMLTELGLR